MAPLTKKILAQIARFENTATLALQQAAELKAMLVEGENAQASSAGPRRGSVQKAVNTVLNNRKRTKYAQ